MHPFPLSNIAIVPVPRCRRVAKQQHKQHHTAAIKGICGAGHLAARHGPSALGGELYLHCTVRRHDKRGKQHGGQPIRVTQKTRT